mgnify:CR=1 FL=1
MSAAPRTDMTLLDAADEVATIGVRGLSGVALQLTGTWSGTVTFEATLEGNTWVAFNMVPSNSATAASTATANGAWSVNCGGYDAVRARFSTATSGTVKVTLQACPSAGRY